MFLNSARASPRLRTRAIHLDGASEPPRFFESNGERIASRGREICTRIAGVAVNPPGDSTGKFVPPVGERSRRASQLDSSISAESAAKHRAVSDPTRARNHDIQPSTRVDIFPSTVSRNGGGNEGALD